MWLPISISLTSWLYSKRLPLLVLLVGFFFFSLFFFTARAADPLPPPPSEAVTGWWWSAHALVSNQPQGIGWISLNSTNTRAGQTPCLNPATQTAACYGIVATLDPSSQVGVLTGYAWSPTLEWICFGSTCPTIPPNGIIGAKVKPVTGDPARWRIEGWAQVMNLGDNGWIRLGPGTQAGEGILIDRVTKNWSGYAWSSALGNSGSGLGWFVPVAAQGGIIIQPWVETKGGDIYSGQNVRALLPASPPGLTNARYVIQASGSGGVTTIDWISQSGLGVPFIGKNAPIKTLPAASKNFSTPLGRIDFAGLNAGQYGAVVLNPGQIPLDLAGKVYIVPHDLVLPSQPLVVASGAGTVIVEGDLTINGNITYNSGQPNQLKSWPSLGWIVLGDIRVGTSVGNLDGSMMALGNGSSCAGAAPAARCGQIFTGATDSALKINGALFAKRFNFERTGRFFDRGSEQIIFDGRLLANPPPGWQDLIKGLPLWQSSN